MPHPLPSTIERRAHAFLADIRAAYPATPHIFPCRDCDAGLIRALRRAELIVPVTYDARLLPNGSVDFAAPSIVTHYRIAG